MEPLFLEDLEHVGDLSLGELLLVLGDLELELGDLATPSIGMPVSEGSEETPVDEDELFEGLGDIGLDYKSPDFVMKDLFGELRAQLLSVVGVVSQELVLYGLLPHVVLEHLQMIVELDAAVLLVHQVLSLWKL